MAFSLRSGQPRHTWRGHAPQTSAKGPGLASSICAHRLVDLALAALDPRRTAAILISKKLAKERGLRIEARELLLGMISRLTAQKGADLVADIVPELQRMRARLVLLTGETTKTTTEPIDKKEAAA